MECSKVEWKWHGLWEQVKLTFNIRYSFNYTSETLFTWDNCQMDETRILSRLDRFYSFINPTGSSPRGDYANIGGATRSDHVPIHFLIELGWAQA